MNRKVLFRAIVLMALVLVLLLAACGGGDLSGGTNVPVVAKSVTTESNCSVASDPPCFVPEGWLRERYYDN